MVTKSISCYTENATIIEGYNILTCVVNWLVTLLDRGPKVKKYFFQDRRVLKGDIMEKLSFKLNAFHFNFISSSFLWVISYIISLYSLYNFHNVFLERKFSYYRKGGRDWWIEAGGGSWMVASILFLLATFTLFEFFLFYCVNSYIPLNKQILNCVVPSSKSQVAQ